MYKLGLLINHFILIAIVDKRVPQEAKEILQKSFTLFELESKSIVYPAISGHPDIFIFQSKETFIVAPNSPKSLLSFLENHQIKYTFGNNKLGHTYPATSFYNALSTSKILIYNRLFTDSSIITLGQKKKRIHVNQSYIACNTIALKGEIFITSDKGIYKALVKNEIEVYYFSPKGISLAGFDYGFIGGCVGVFDHTIYFIGKLSYYPEGRILKTFLEKRSYKIVELYDGPLFDGGGIVFI